MGGWRRARGSCSIRAEIGLDALFFQAHFFNAVNRRARDDLDRAAALFERPTEIRSNDVASLIVLLATVCELTTQRSD